MKIKKTIANILIDVFMTANSQKLTTIIKQLANLKESRVHKVHVWVNRLLNAFNVEFQISKISKTDRKIRLHDTDL